MDYRYFRHDFRLIQLIICLQLKTTMKLSSASAALAAANSMIITTTTAADDDSHPLWLAKQQAASSVEQMTDRDESIKQQIKPPLRIPPSRSNLP